MSEWEVSIIISQKNSIKTKNIHEKLNNNNNNNNNKFIHSCDID